MEDGAQFSLRQFRRFREKLAAGRGLGRRRDGRGSAARLRPPAALRVPLLSLTAEAGDELTSRLVLVLEAEALAHPVIAVNSGMAFW